MGKVRVGKIGFSFPVGPERPTEKNKGFQEKYSPSKESCTPVAAARSPRGMDPLLGMASSTLSLINVRIAISSAIFGVRENVSSYVFIFTKVLLFISSLVKSIQLTSPLSLFRCLIPRKRA